MKELALFLDILTKANLITPAIAGIYGIFKSGREAGKTDPEIEEESMTFALNTRSITEKDMSNEP